MALYFSIIRICVCMLFKHRLFLFLGRSAWYNKIWVGENERECFDACFGKLKEIATMWNHFH